MIESHDAGVMMRTIWLISALAVSASIAPGATAQTTAPTAPPADSPAGATPATAPPAVTIAPPAKTPAELAKIKYQTEIVCHTSIETGSLIAKHKTCLTRKQWAYVNEENQRQARRFVEDNTGKPTSN